MDTQVAATKALTIVVVEEDRDRAIAIVDALKDASECEVFVIGKTSGLARKIAAHAPDAQRVAETRRELEERKFIEGSVGDLASRWYPRCLDAEVCIKDANSEKGFGGLSASYWGTTIEKTHQHPARQNGRFGDVRNKAPASVPRLQTDAA